MKLYRSPYEAYPFLADADEDLRCDFEILTDKLWDAYNIMRTYYPMSDWYYCDTSHMCGMYHRSVQGGLFIKLMLD